MISLIPVLVFISLYSLAIIGNKKGEIFFALGLLTHAGYILYRALHLGWLPVTERHDILLVISIAVAFSFFYLKKKVPLNILLDTLPLFVVFLSILAVFQSRIDTIEPNMSSKWFYIYIIFFMSGFFFFTVSSIAGILYLREKSILYEVMQYRLSLFGWLFFSFSLIGGSLWFYLTYGSSGTKQSFITWARRLSRNTPLCRRSP